MEAKLKFRLETINPWAPEEAFLDLCAEGTPPALTDVTSAGMLPGEPAHPPTLRAGREAMHRHFEYFTWLLERRDYLAGRHFSLADIAGVAHLSCLDFLGEIRWRDWPEIKDWYQNAIAALRAISPVPERVMQRCRRKACLSALKAGRGGLHSKAHN